MASDPLFLVTLLAVVAVAVVLLIGLGGFARGKEFNRKHANRVMRWRIGLQALAVALILLFIFLRQGA
jgi:hypothetical protein